MDEEKKEPVNPLSVQLEKGAHVEAHPLPGSDKGENPPEKSAEKPGAQKKRTAQRDFLQLVYKKIDERIDTHPALRGGRTSGLLILIVLLVFPFFFRMGSEFYDLAKINLPAYLGLPPFTTVREEPKPVAVKPREVPAKVEIPAKGEGAIPGKLLEKLLSQNKEIIDQNRKLIETLSKTPPPKNRVSNKLVIIHNQPGRFSLKEEKKKIYEISGLDFDDPIAGTNVVGGIKSPEILITLLDSFNRILLNTDSHPISEFHVKNAIEGKKQAMARLRELK